MSIFSMFIEFLLIAIFVFNHLFAHSYIIWSIPIEYI